MYSALAKVPGIKFFVLSGNVTYLKPSDRPDEVLIPQDNTSILLDVLAKSLSAKSASGITIIFNSVTDMVVTLGLEETYKFLRRVNELLSETGAGGMFLLTPGAHDQKVVSVVRSLFSNQLILGRSGGRIVKGQAVAPTGA